ncbi:MAG: ABC transporter substrate-binding protein [Gemmataceae bacterium]|nr:ABC transporter substrate-binding protein [Gemmataceae bacterium]MDW8267508.1 ABC transporter substrate-binding protein [Gemmataceae bacterium]
MTRWFVVVGVVLATLSGCRQSETAGGPRPLVWAADAEGGAPYVFKDPNDPAKHIGFEVDLADALAKELGRPIRFKQYEYVSLFSGLERGDFDFAMNGLEVTPDRQAKVRFSKPYYVYKQQLVARAGETRFRSIDDLKGSKQYTVGTLEDTAAARLLKKFGIPVKEYTGQVEPYSDLKLARLDAVLLDLPIAIYYARRDPELQFLGPPVEPGYYAIAFRRSDEGLAQEVDAALHRLRQAGTIRQILEKWNLWNEDQEELNRSS